MEEKLVTDLISWIVEVNDLLSDEQLDALTEDPWDLVKRLKKLKESENGED